MLANIASSDKYIQTLVAVEIIVALQEIGYILIRLSVLLGFFGLFVFFTLRERVVWLCHDLCFFFKKKTEVNRSIVFLTSEYL